MSKVLIVEDEEAIADIEKDYLELSGFEVTICKDGTSGLAEALDGEYDICILDVMLPGIDGFEICKECKKIEFLCCKYLLLTINKYSSCSLINLDTTYFNYIILWLRAVNKSFIS